MDTIWQGLVQAVELIIQGNPDLFAIIWLSLRVSGIALLFSTLIGIPLGALMGLSRFTGRRLVMAVTGTASSRIKPASPATRATRARQ